MHIFPLINMISLGHHPRDRLLTNKTDRLFRKFQEFQNTPVNGYCQVTALGNYWIFTMCQVLYLGGWQEYEVALNMVCLQGI